MLNVYEMPIASDASSRCQTSSCPSQYSSATVPLTVTAVVWVISNERRRSHESAIAPPIGDMMVMAMPVMAPLTPSQNGESPISNKSQPKVSCCIQELN